MRTITRHAVLSIVTLSLIISIIASSGITANVQAGGTPTYTTHSTIRINGDADLAALKLSGDCTGSGTTNDPYVISGYDITGSNGICIYIGNTTSNLTIKNCYLHGASYVSSYAIGGGIQLYNAKFIALNNNTCSGNSYCGIYMSSSSSNVMENNTISSNNEAGIWLLSSSSNIMKNNICNYNSVGIYMSSSNNNVMNNNTCNDNTNHGICLSYSSSNVMENNTISDNSNGIYMSPSNNNVIKNNTIRGNSNDGIYMSSSSSNVMENNTISSNSNYGLSLSSSSSNVVENNTFNDDTNYGICLSYSSSKNLIENNSCSGNVNGIGIYSSNNNVIENNNCSGNVNGTFLASSNNNFIEYNSYASNGYGIYLAYSSGTNVIMNNAVDGSSSYGVYITASNYNRIFGNVLKDNNGALSTYSSSRIQAYDDSVNYWNATGTGNCWSDLTMPDCNYDGIVDTPYFIAGGSDMDLFPLAAAYVMLTSPSNGSVVYTSTVLVTGTANPYDELDVNGVLTHVCPSGSFSVMISLPEGKSVIEARSINPVSHASDSVNITYIDSSKIIIDNLDQQLNDTRMMLNETSDQLNDINAQLNEERALLSATMAHLNESNDQLSASRMQSSDALNALNATTTIADNAKKDASTAQTIAIVGIVFGVVGIALASVMFMSSRRPKTP
jgi:parallel beta-helix repeat protein